MKKILLCASYSVVEPLGIMYLSEIARQEGWEIDIWLFVEKLFDYNFTEKVLKNKYDLVGFSVYTGNHLDFFHESDILRKNGFKVIMGGYHATYYPEDCLKHADYVVLSEGFNSFRKILRGEVSPGIIPLINQDNFPISYREPLYNSYPEFRKSAIKGIIASTGCYYSCNYCYNSSEIEILRDRIDNLSYDKMKMALNPFKKIFPIRRRDVSDIISEIVYIMRTAPKTKLIFFYDDVFGLDMGWLKEFRQKHDFRIPYHCQMRLEMVDEERLNLLGESGCSGITLALETASKVARKEILNRPMETDFIFEKFDLLKDYQFTIRTEQMLGLPFGSTERKTAINLDADLETLELNVALKMRTGLPTMAWASIFQPYRGTKLGEYCFEKGFYNGDNDDLPKSFFDKSVLRFPRTWIGPDLKKENVSLWLNEEENKEYIEKMKILRDLFDTFACIPNGHKAVRKFLEQDEQNLETLSKVIKNHLYDSELYKII